MNFFRTTDYGQQSTDFGYAVKLKSHVVTIEFSTPNALGIEAASFASVFGTTGFGDGELGLGTRLGSGENFKRAKI